MFRQWLCHPLSDPHKINARLDAVDTLLADDSFRETFVYQLGKLPDLERLISRIHAGVCKAQNFVRVLEGFEQIRDAMAALSANGPEDGLIGQLVKSLPNLDGKLGYWETAFDRRKAKDDGVLVPERGVEEDFDNSQDQVEEIMATLNGHLSDYQKEYKYVYTARNHSYINSDCITGARRSALEISERRFISSKSLQRSKMSRNPGPRCPVRKRSSGTIPRK